MPTQGARYSLEAGELFEQNYRIVRELGRGGFGVIYLAHQLSMDRPVALKILKPGVGRHDPNARERFLREVKIISRLRHPNTVTIHDYGEGHDGIVYMVLEYVEGTTLKDALRHRGAQPVMKSLGIARQVARSLDEAHRHGIIHRDLKPDNIMLTDLEGDSDFVKVLDFGVARLRNDPDVDLTQAGVAEGQRALIGTPRYMSPEQVRGEELSAASDLYGLGLMLYECLIGRPAVEGDTSMALISQQISPDPLELSELPALHPRLQDLLRRATDKEVSRRFQSGSEFADAIDETASRIQAEDRNSRRSKSDDFFATSGRFSAVPAAASGGADAETTSNEWVDQGFDPADFTSEHQAIDGIDDSSGAGCSGVGNRRDPGSTDSSIVYVDDADDIDDESRLLGIPSSEMPDAPGSDPSPFAEASESTTNDPTAMPAPTSSNDDTTNADDESALAFGWLTVKLCFLGTMAAFFVYTAFLVVGALLGTLTDGPIRLGVALGVGVAIPLFTALGENSQKERFEVVDRRADRIGRVFIGSSVFAAASILIISFAMPANVTDNLRSEPNWMFSPDTDRSELIGLNENISYTVADMIHMATFDIGWTGLSDGQARDSVEQSDDAAEPIEAPEPTRPGTRGTGSDDVPPDDGDEAHRDSAANGDASQNNDDPSDDYVTW